MGMLWYLLIALVLSARLGEAASKTAIRLREADIDRILANNRVVTAYVRCLLDRDPCSPDGAELKRAIPDALTTGCSKCSDNEKLLSEKVIAHLMRKRKGDWSKLIAKYDPQGDFAKRYATSTARPSRKRKQN